MAATNRIRTLARCLAENSIKVKVVCLRAHERISGKIFNREPFGNVDGIEYIYACGTTIRGKTFIRRRWLRLKGFIYTLMILRSINNRSKADAMLIYMPHSVIIVVYFFLLAKIYRFIFIRDVLEHPLVFQRKSLLLRLHDKFYLKYAFKLYDALFVITKNLENDFVKRVRNGIPLLFVPMTVEAGRFVKAPAILSKTSRFIAYCGYLGGTKDGVPDLIKSFALISNKYRDLMLYIIGEARESDVLQHLQKLSRELGIDDKIVFTGRVSRDEIPKYLCNATILALARPASLQADYGFPSKLGEYLATGNPVVVTDVGEISLFLQDGKSAFIAQPGNATAFAKKMEYILENPNIAKEVGLNGQRVAYEKFDYSVQGKKIIEFLNTISAHRGGRTNINVGITES
jgi:glycosyltransferase involved in cell wall biosynthesis